MSDVIRCISWFSVAAVIPFSSVLFGVSRGNIGVGVSLALLAQIISLGWLVAWYKTASLIVVFICWLILFFLVWFFTFYCALYYLVNSSPEW